MAVTLDYLGLKLEQLLAEQRALRDDLERFEHRLVADLGRVERAICKGTDQLQQALLRQRAVIDAINDRLEAANERLLEDRRRLLAAVRRTGERG